MKSEQYTLSVSETEDGARLDQYLAEHVPDLSRARAQTLIRSGMVTVGGCQAKPSHRVRSGELISARIDRHTPSSFQPETIPLDIVFEDAHIIVVNKPAGMVVHPASGISSGTLVNALLAHAPDLPEHGGKERPGIVHRLDKNTSGLLIVAKTETSHRRMAERIRQHEVKRIYRALVYGNFEESGGVVDAPIGRSPSNRKKMAITGIRSREARTEFHVEESFREATLLRVRLATGRTHQIRVHMNYIGHPVVGDSVYGTGLSRFHERMEAAVVKAISRLQSHMLHAERLEFSHPETGDHMSFEAPLPGEFAEMIQLLRNVARRE